MEDLRFSRGKVKKFLKTLHAHRKRLGTKQLLSRLEGVIEPRTLLQEKIHALKIPEEKDDRFDKLYETLSHLAAKVEERETKIENVHHALKEMQQIIEKIVAYEEEEKKTKMTAREKHLSTIEQQLAAFEARLVEAAKRYQDEALFPLKQKIQELREKHRQLLEKKEAEEALPPEEEEKAEELRKRIETLELPSQPSEEEKEIEEAVEKITEEIAAQEVKLELPDFLMPEEEELSLPPPVPELEMAEEEVLPPPPTPKKRESVLDTMFGEVKRLLSKT